VLEAHHIMQQLVDWLNVASEIHPVLIAGITQFQLVHIQIKTDLLAQKHRLNERQIAVIARLVDHQSLTIRDFEELCPNVSRRTLQRDLQNLEELGLVAMLGDTNQLKYHLALEL